MAIQQTKKQSDLEKRLQLLRRQVYGGNTQSSGIRYQISDKNTNESDNQQMIVNNNSMSDVIYLRQDLLKIFAFSSIAIGVQVVLFFLLKNHILNLKLF